LPDVLECAIPRHRELSPGVARAIAAKPAGNDKEADVARYIAIVDGKPGAFGVVIPDFTWMYLRRSYCRCGIEKRR
jgi:hypothetical protein